MSHLTESSWKRHKQVKQQPNQPGSPLQLCCHCPLHFCCSCHLCFHYVHPCQLLCHRVHPSWLQGLHCTRSLWRKEWEIKSYKLVFKTAHIIITPKEYSIYNVLNVRLCFVIVMTKQDMELKMISCNYIYIEKKQAMFHFFRTLYWEMTVAFTESQFLNNFPRDNRVFWDRNLSYQITVFCMLNCQSFLQKSCNSKDF